MKPTITFEDFSKIDMRIGTIIEIHDFPEARKPAYQLSIDFGDIGIKKSSAQITAVYSKSDLINKQVVAIINFEKKQIANFFSECLILGVENKENNIVLLQSNFNKLKNGTKIS
jgi:tRNA-binding protein